MELVIVVVLWLVTAWRLPTARQEPWRRALWAAFAALALALTFSLPRVASATDHASGVTGLANLLMHLSGVAACAAVLEWVTALTPAVPGPDRSRVLIRRALPAVTIIALAALFAVIPHREDADFTGDMVGNPVAAAYLLVFEAYLGATMAVATVLFARAAAQARRPGLLAWGLQLLASGTAAGTLYAAARSIVTMIAAAGGTVPGSAALAVRATHLLQDAAILLILAGTSIPALAVAARAARAYRALLALRPLWSRLTAAVPQVVLGAPPTRRDDLRAGGAELHGRLARRVTEIRDAALILRSYVSDTDAETVRDRLAASGLPGEELETAAEAAWLRAAAYARLAGRRPAAASATRPLSGGSDVTAEARALRLVAAAWTRPDVISAASAITAGALQQETR